MENPTIESLMSCAICKQAVDLGDGVTDQSGRTVHEECYTKQLADGIPEPGND